MVLISGSLPYKTEVVSVRVLGFIEGLTGSIDWYQIHLSGGITTPAFQDVINRCRAGELVYCPSLIFQNGGGWLSR